MRVECECGTAAWVAGTLPVPSAQTRTASATGVMALSEAFFEPLVAGAGPVLLTLLFPPLVPSSYQVLHGSMYSFPLDRYSCPLSAGVPHALLCLKVYS